MPVNSYLVHFTQPGQPERVYHGLNTKKFVHELRDPEDDHQVFADFSAPSLDYVEVTVDQTYYGDELELFLAS